MDFDLRQAILNNIKGKSEEQLKEMIVSSIEEHEERTLPGLGVLFEVIWTHVDPNTQETLVDTLSKSI
ncbi:small acid-soluble spore protein SspI [Tepidibacillus marianensis]|uniref:small acid-soluble spore protein SspI n=1 Tax=Tepidibacillus marianensis TaxID=3131995 RepID=UPI0030D62893